MSFRIFAAGTGNFHYTRNGLDFGDVYDVADGLSRIASVTGGARSAATGIVTDAATPTSGVRQALNAYGQIEGLHLLHDSVEMMVVDMGSVQVMVYARQARTFWVDNTAVATVMLANDDDDPAVTFLRRVNPVLAETEMNTFGVLAAIAGVMTRFSTEGARADNGRCMLNIQIFR